MKFLLDDEEVVERKVAGSVFSAITDSIVDTQSAITVLAITVTAEIGALAMVYVARDKFNEFLETQGDFWIYAGIGAFLVGFLTAFATVRLFQLRISRFTVLLVSIFAGGVNIALFFVLLTLRMR